MIKGVQANSLKENRKKSRLPAFTPDEIRYVKGTADFLGLNYYSSNFAEPAFDLSWAKVPSFYRDQSVHTTSLDEWPVAESSWLKSVPHGLRALLKYCFFHFFFYLINTIPPFQLD